MSTRTHFPESVLQRVLKLATFRTLPRPLTPNSSRESLSCEGQPCCPISQMEHKVYCEEGGAEAKERNP